MATGCRVDERNLSQIYVGVPPLSHTHLTYLTRFDIVGA